MDDLREEVSLWTQTMKWRGYVSLFDFGQETSRTFIQRRSGRGRAKEALQPCAQLRLLPGWNYQAQART
jgi:hypothetical protein